MARLRACSPGAGFCGTPLGALSLRRPKQVRCANTSALVVAVEDIQRLVVEGYQLEALSSALGLEKACQKRDVLGGCLRASTVAALTKPPRSAVSTDALLKQTSSGANVSGQRQSHSRSPEPRRPRSKLGLRAEEDTSSAEDDDSLSADDILGVLNFEHGNCITEKHILGSQPTDAASMEPEHTRRRTRQKSVAFQEDAVEGHQAGATDLECPEDRSLEVAGTNVGGESVTETGNRGDPLGRKALGKAAVKWLSQGLGAFAAELIAAELRGLRLVEVHGSSAQLMAAVQSSLAKQPMPPGAEDKCQVAAAHFPTVWDHLQREVQWALQALEAKGHLSTWKGTQAWRLVKGLGKSDEHKLATKGGKALEPGNVFLPTERIYEIHASLKAFVDRALRLLKLERDAELLVTQNLIGDFKPKSSESGSESERDQPEEHMSEQRGEATSNSATADHIDTLRHLKLVKSATGLGGMHLVTLRDQRGQQLPPHSFTPGDMVCIRGEGGKTGKGASLCTKGTVYSLEDDGAGLAVAVNVRYGDAALSKLFGKDLRMDRISALADATTYDRNCDALETLEKMNLNKKAPAASIVATLFGDGPELSWQPVQGMNQSILKEDEDQGPRPVGSEGLRLDESQEQSVSMALDKHMPCVLIQGPPGTGKTTVVTEVICKAVVRGERVLVTAPTNAAVDNLVEKLSGAGLSIVRVGNPARVSPTVASHSLSHQVDVAMSSFRREAARRRADLRQDIRLCNGQGEDALEAGLRQMLKQLGRALRVREKETILDILSSAQVILCTNTGAGDPLVQKLPAFDLVIIDEAGQATEPSCWIPILQGRRLVLAGDPCQLAPTVLSREAAMGGLSISLMERAMSLHNGRLLVLLDTQYRMNSAIANWCSSELYNGRLKSAPAVADRLLCDSSGVRATRDTTRSMLVLDTRLPRGGLLPGCEEATDPSGTGSLYNDGEAEAVLQHIDSLLSAGVPPTSIAVQSPYLAQVQLIRDQLEGRPGAAGVEVASVDAFQGRESDAVIISMVRSNAAGTVGFLGDRRRMNVAVTRAKAHIAIVCDTATVGKNPFVRRLLQHIREAGELRTMARSGLPQRATDRGSIDHELATQNDQGLSHRRGKGLQLTVPTGKVLLTAAG
eukprot:SM000074S21675  [mRNA]  locus=s74:339511:345042:+ [translate_table: standard]